MEIPLLAKKELMIDMTRLSDFTSKLRSQSTHLAHGATRCRKSECPTLHTRPTAVHFQQQRGWGSISLGRRIRGWRMWGLPGAGKGGMMQLAVGWVANISMLVLGRHPPVIARPAIGKMYEIQTTGFHWIKVYLCFCVSTFPQIILRRQNMFYKSGEVISGQFKIFPT